jgi:hypothetical protein|tara:strand:+ start:496 stop:723 length:228 start_codon:yes stop_codon:yes gene_type:complete
MGELEQESKMTNEEVSLVADRLDDIIGNAFHDVVYAQLRERPGYEDTFISDEDILRIKEDLAQSYLDQCKDFRNK